MVKTADSDQDFTLLDPPIMVTEEDFSNLLTEAEVSFLSDFIDSNYLKPTELLKLRNKFVKDSNLNLIEFLDYEFSCKLKHDILLNEACDTVALNQSIVSGTGSALYPSGFRGPRFENGTYQEEWQAVGPPHKHRYLTPRASGSVVNPAVQKLHTLKTLLEAPSFIKWLSFVSASQLNAHTVIPRRFRPGLDYTLATTNKNMLLELHLCLTPSHGWDTGDLGGWECYMASTDEAESDPAIYKAPKPDAMEGEGSESDDGSTLLTIYPSWNQFHLVLRDAEILTFTKYVSFKASGGKWDIKAAYQIEADEEDEDDDEGEGEQDMKD